jgi:hypothetical protein
MHPGECAAPGPHAALELPESEQRDGLTQREHHVELDTPRRPREVEAGEEQRRTQQASPSAQQASSEPEGEQDQGDTGEGRREAGCRLGHALEGRAGGGRHPEVGGRLLGVDLSVEMQHDEALGAMSQRAERLGDVRVTGLVRSPEVEAPESGEQQQRRTEEEGELGSFPLGRSCHGIPSGGGGSGQTVPSHASTTTGRAVGEVA